MKSKRSGRCWSWPTSRGRTTWATKAARRCTSMWPARPTRTESARWPAGPLTLYIGYATKPWSSRAGRTQFGPKGWTSNHEIAEAIRGQRSPLDSAGAAFLDSPSHGAREVVSSVSASRLAAHVRSLLRELLGPRRLRIHPGCASISVGRVLARPARRSAQGPGQVEELPRDLQPGCRYERGAVESRRGGMHGRNHHRHDGRLFSAC